MRLGEGVQSDSLQLESSPALRSPGENPIPSVRESQGVPSHRVSQDDVSTVTLPPGTCSLLDSAYVLMEY